MASATFSISERITSARSSPNFCAARRMRNSNAACTQVPIHVRPQGLTYPFDVRKLMSSRCVESGFSQG